MKPRLAKVPWVPDRGWIAGLGKGVRRIYPPRGTIAQTHLLDFLLHVLSPRPMLHLVVSLEPLPLQKQFRTQPTIMMLLDRLPEMFFEVPQILECPLLLTALLTHTTAEVRLQQMHHHSLLALKHIRTPLHNASGVRFLRMLRGIHEGFKRGSAVHVGTREPARRPVTFRPVFHHVIGGLERVDTGNGLAPDWIIMRALVVAQHGALAQEDLAAASDTALEGLSV